MKLFLLLSLFLLSFALTGYFLRSKPSTEWMCKDNTSVIKGVAILSVVWAHTGAVLGAKGIQFIAGIGVSLFLICSGYGMEVSYGKNGINHYWRKRLYKVLIPFWGSELIGMLVFGTFNVRDYVLDSLFVQRATSYGWFVRYILICYLIFFVVKIASKKARLSEDVEIGLLLGVFFLWFIVSSTVLVEPARPFTEPRQMISFPFGYFWQRNTK